LTIYGDVKMPQTVSIPKEEYEELIRYKHIIESEKSRFNFGDVFSIGSGKLKGQEVKDMLRKEW